MAERERAVREEETRVAAAAAAVDAERRGLEEEKKALLKRKNREWDEDADGEGDEDGDGDGDGDGEEDDDEVAVVYSIDRVRKLGAGPHVLGLLEYWEQNDPTNALRAGLRVLIGAGFVREVVRDEEDGCSRCWVWFNVRWLNQIPNLRRSLQDFAKEFFQFARQGNSARYRMVPSEYTVAIRGKDEGKGVTLKEGEANEQRNGCLVCPDYLGMEFWG